MIQIEWDTHFFNKATFKLDCENIEHVNFSNLPANSMTYIYSEVRSEKFEAALCDRKVTYTVPVSDDLPVLSNEFKTITDNTNVDAIYQLAIDSSHLSRFRVDKKIGDSLADEVYKSWVESALVNLNSNQIIVSISSGTISGMVLLSFKGKICSIDMIAVHSQFHRQGLGRALIYKSISEARKKGCKHIKVVTQENNLPACKLYESCGFQLSEKRYVYHIHK